MTDTNYDKMNRVYNPNGLAPTIETPSGGGKMPKIEVVGDLHLEKQTEGGKRNNHANDVLGVNGISTCIVAACGEGGGHVPKIEVVGDLNNGSNENGKVYSVDGISPAIVASAGDHGNHVRIEVSEQSEDGDSDD